MHASLQPPVQAMLYQRGRVASLGLPSCSISLLCTPTPRPLPSLRPSDDPMACSLNMVLWYPSCVQSNPASTTSATFSSVVISTHLFPVDAGCSTFPCSPFHEVRLNPNIRAAFCSSSQPVADFTPSVQEAKQCNISQFKLQHSIDCGHTGLLLDRV